MTPTEIEARAQSENRLKKVRKPQCTMVFSLDTELVRLIDGAWEKRGYRSRSDMIREVLKKELAGQ